MTKSERPTALGVVTVAAAVTFVVSVSIVVITLVNGRPLPGVNALLVPALLLGIAGGAWVRYSIRSSDTPSTGKDRLGATFTNRFTNPRAWSGLPRSARVTFACGALASFLVAASANPLYGGYNNDPSLPICTAGTSGGPACVPSAVHQHALAAHQRFVAAILAGVCIVVVGAARGRRRSPVPAVGESVG
jgi:hypothetical protein